MQERFKRCSIFSQGRRSPRPSSLSTVPRAHQNRCNCPWLHLNVGNFGGLFLQHRCAKAHIAAEDFCTTLRGGSETFTNSWRSSFFCGVQNLKLEKNTEEVFFVDAGHGVEDNPEALMCLTRSVWMSAASDTHAILRHAAEMVVREEPFARNASASGLNARAGCDCCCCSDRECGP